MNWDAEVDVVCTRAGVAGLACAISAVDLGGEVFVADSSGPSGEDVEKFPVRARIDRLHPWLGVDVRDSETNDYLAALASDLGPLRRSTWDIDVPVRVVRQPVPVDSGVAVAPFVGARLREWTACCLASPYGFLFTRVGDWPTTTLQTADGEAIEVAEIGTMAPEPGDVSGSVHEWLTAQAHDRRIRVHRGTSLSRIVFEDGAVLGALFSTPDGPLAVRARYGVTVATGGPQISASARYQLGDTDNPLRVCLVGQRASRFGRVELLTSESVAQPPAPTCRSTSRQLRVRLHESPTQSYSWRCGKVDGYPPRSQ